MPRKKGWNSGWNSDWTDHYFLELGWIYGGYQREFFNVEIGRNSRGILAVVDVGEDQDIILF